ncbi:MAG: DUF1311 domain-containing protein [Spirochaetia bacterium]|nr:DUF1311 domain-containing protein [Spirochaetia bacterium]
MVRYRNALAFVVLLVSFVAVGAEPNICDPNTKPDLRVCLKAAYQKRDSELNEVYKKLIPLLSARTRKALQDSSISWIRAKEADCKTSSPSGDQEFYACLLRSTDERLRFLTKLLGRVRDADIAGYYSDESNGSVTIIQVGPNEYLFEMRVVRGPTFHTGQYNGVFRRTGNSIKYRWSTSDPMVMKCDLNFTIEPGALQVEEVDCSGFHGARAYFDGTYFKIE